MSKFLNISGIVVCFVLALLSIGFSETLTVTTYYPSPFGSYQDLRANQMAIGSGYSSFAVADGNLLVQGGIGVNVTTINAAYKLEVNGPISTTNAPANFIRAEITTAGGSVAGIIGGNSALGAWGYLGSNAVAGGAGVYGLAQVVSAYSGYFSGGLGVGISGDLNVTGTITAAVVNKGSGTFLIDHPLDPENKILRHSFMESPDMKNVYDGITILDGKGESVVNLPDYFEALNKDFRYQLTAIGIYAPLYVKQEIKDNKFVIAGGKRNQKVSWMVTGIRKDAYALKNPIVVEEEKGLNNKYKKGEYVYPEVIIKK